MAKAKAKTDESVNPETNKTNPPVENADEIQTPDVSTEPEKPTEPESIKVKIASSALNVRKGPGLGNPVVKTLINDKNTYEIVKEVDGWGEIANLGWIALQYTKKA